jgi:acetyl esterase/lipase
MTQYSLSSGAQTAALQNVSYQASEVIQIWPGIAPGETGEIGPEHVLPDRPRPFDQITDVSVPTLSVFLPPEERRTGTAMLVIPGGGLDRLAIEHEGIEVAEWLNDRGIAAFVLKYRVPPRDPKKRWKVGLQDAQRAMSIIRLRAGEWRVDSEAIGCIGFSAGGEINVMLSTYYNERQYEPVDGADTHSTRPDFNSRGRRRTPRPLEPVSPSIAVAISRSLRPRTESPGPRIRPASCCGGFRRGTVSC